MSKASAVLSAACDLVNRHGYSCIGDTTWEDFVALLDGYVVAQGNFWLLDYLYEDQPRKLVYDYE